LHVYVRNKTYVYKGNIYETLIGRKKIQTQRKKKLRESFGRQRGGREGGMLGLLGVLIKRIEKEKIGKTKSK